MNTVSADSQKIVAEKTRLSRDLASLQSEVERLRSQAAATSAVIAEKQALERQFNALDVELENEKRAHEHTRAHASQLSDEIVALTTKLDETRKKLAEVESNAHQQSRKWTSERSTLEAKIESLNRKQSLDNESLTAQQANHQRRPAEPEATRLADPPPRTIPLKDQSRSSRFDPGMTISTPGAVRGAEKKKQPIARPGEKSAFSITPFLERTKGRDSTMSSDESENDTPVARAVDRAREQRSEVPSEGRSIAPGNREPSVSANEAAPEEQPAQAKPKAKVTKKTQKKPSDLVDASDMAGTSASLFNRAPGLGMAKTKKRKLGGQRDRTLLDDDVEEEIRKDIKKPAGKQSNINTPSQSQANPHGPSVRCIFDIFAPEERSAAIRFVGRNAPSFLGFTMTIIYDLHNGTSFELALWTSRTGRCMWHILSRFETIYRLKHPTMTSGSLVSTKIGKMIMPLVMVIYDDQWGAILDCFKPNR